MKKTPSNYAKDKIFADPIEKTSPFSFNEKVVEVFPDMINRSVPGYATIIHSLPRILYKQLQPNSVVYDLGCSLGAASQSIASTGIELSIYAVDYSEAMVTRCQHRMNAFNYPASIEVSQNDVTTMTLKPCDIVIMNFTLQFIPPEKRSGVIEKVFNALKPGGCFILSEKIQFDDTDDDQLLIELHHQFKRDNGYSELEISQKRNALENVMVLDTLDTHVDRLKRAGFTTATSWFQHFNFSSMMAVKK